MTLDAVFNRLCALAAMPAGRRSTLLASDLVEQNNLYAIQNVLSALLLDVATAVGPKADAHLAKRFPRSFHDEYVVEAASAPKSAPTQVGVGA